MEIIITSVVIQTFPFGTPTSKPTEKPTTSTPKAEKRSREQAITPSPTATQKSHKTSESVDNSFESCGGDQERKSTSEEDCDSDMAPVDPALLEAIKQVVERIAKPIRDELRALTQICTGSSENLKKRIDSIEKKEREKNLIIYGIKKDPKENVESKLKALEDEIWKKIGMASVLVDDVFRIGKKDPAKPRALLVKLVRKVDRDLTMIKKKALGKTSPVLVRKDQSPEERTRDYKLREHFRSLKARDKDLTMFINEGGKMTTWKAGQFYQQFTYDSTEGIKQI